MKNKIIIAGFIPLVLVAILVLSIELLHGLGWTRVGTILVSITAVLCISFVVFSWCRGDEAEDIILPISFSLTFLGVLSWMFFYNPQADFSTMDHWGKWGPMIGHITNRPGLQMALECLVIGLTIISVASAVLFTRGRKINEKIEDLLDVLLPL